MRIQREKIKLIGLMALLALTLSCSNENDGESTEADESAQAVESSSDDQSFRENTDGEGVSDEGSGSLTVRGAHEGEFAATHGGITLGVGSLETGNPKIMFDINSRAFLLSFEMDDAAEPPPEGEYTIGEDGDITAVFTEYSRGFMNRYDYSAVGDLTGSLTITSSSPTEMQGTFEFDASNTYPEENADAVVHVTDGTFQVFVRDDD
jgi:hypothetical protein